MILRSVPRVLRPHHPWLFENNNRKHLRLFLRAHQVDINDVALVTFGVKSMSVLRFAKNENGQRFVNDNEEVAMEEPLEVSYRAGLGPGKLLP